MAEKLNAEELSELRAAADSCDLLGYATEVGLLLDEHAALTARVAELEAANAKLEKDSDFLDALRAAGVDNWCGYDEAVSSLHSEDGEE